MATGPPHRQASRINADTHSSIKTSPEAGCPAARGSPGASIATPPSQRRAERRSSAFACAPVANRHSKRNRRPRPRSTDGAAKTANCANPERSLRPHGVANREVTPMRREASPPVTLTRLRSGSPARRTPIRDRRGFAVGGRAAWKLRLSNGIGDCRGLGCRIRGDMLFRCWATLQFFAKERETGSKRRGADLHPRDRSGRAGPLCAENRAPRQSAKNQA